MNTTKMNIVSRIRAALALVAVVAVITVGLLPLQSATASTSGGGGDPAFPAAPGTLEKVVKANGLELSWDAVPGATGYEYIVVPFGDSTDGRWRGVSQVQECAGRPCTTLTLQTDVPYYFADNQRSPIVNGGRKYTVGVRATKGFEAGLAAIDPVTVNQTPAAESWVGWWPERYQEIDMRSEAVYLSCRSRIKDNAFAWGNQVTGWEWYRNGQRADSEFSLRGAVAYPAGDHEYAEFMWTPPGSHVSPAKLSCKALYGPGSVTATISTTDVTITHAQSAAVDISVKNTCCRWSGWQWVQIESKPAWFENTVTNYQWSTDWYLDTWTGHGTHQPWFWAPCGRDVTFSHWASNNQGEQAYTKETIRIPSC